MVKYWISHRGNTNGRLPLEENKPEYILKALKNNYDVEIDVWVVNSVIWLGHDNPQYEINLNFLKNTKLWCHAKNFEALILLNENKDTIHSFSHDNDNYILTSNATIWAFPGQQINKDTICVMPERVTNYTDNDLYNCLGICSDYIDNYKRKLSNFSDVKQNIYGGPAPYDDYCGVVWN